MMHLSERVKTMLLLTVFAWLVFTFGFSVGEHAARSERAWRDAKRVMRELDRFVKGDKDVI